MSLAGKIIELRTEAAAPSDEFIVGKRLRSLREIADLTIAQMAEKLGIGHRALSNLENRGDVPVSVMRQYVEALGATLHINAAFPIHSTVGFRIADALECDITDENQLVLPIFGDEDFRPQRDVILSIKPKYSSQILVGKKTIELRRRFPVNVPSGTLAYIYSTTPDKALVGFAEIDSVVKKKVSTIWRSYREEACISKSDFDSYFSGQEFGFALRFRQAKAFKHPIDLVDLRERFGFEPPQSFLYAKPLFRETLRHEFAELSH